MVKKKVIKTKKTSARKSTKSLTVKTVKKKPGAVKTKKKAPLKMKVVNNISTAKKQKKEDIKTKEKKNGGVSYFAKWTSLEHIISREDKALYYVAMILSLIAAVWYIMQGSFVVVMTFFVLLVVIFLQLFIAPREVKYVIDLDGISFGSILYKYSDIRSFEVEIGEGVNILKIELNITFLPIKEINLSDQDPYYIRAVLENFLLEKKLEATLFSFGKKQPEDEYFSDDDLDKFLREIEEKKDKNK
ncbi:hypothetical protein KAJ41_00120 [Candidatus Parcubacteria bacterium]|nr:hypothetical protein [Candidatus Parcubacteria bacterium]